MYSPELESKLRSKKDFLERFPSHSGKSLVSFVNPFSYGIIAGRKEIFSKFDWYSDGALLCFLSNINRDRKIDRVSFDFSSIADFVFSKCSEHDLRVALIGGTETEVVAAERYLRSRFDKLNVCYCRNGYVCDSDILAVTRDLESARADVVVVGMGTPLQEEFILNIEGKVSSKYFFTCGGFLTQTSMSGDYYHPLVKATGTRWLQRAFMHSHVRKRLMRDYPIFICGYLAGLVKARLRRSKF